MNPNAYSESASRSKVKFDPDAPPQSFTKKKKKVDEEDFSNDLSKKKVYISRRTKNYDDSASDDGAGEESEGSGV